MSKASSRWQQLKEEWQKNQRLRVGVAVIGGILAIWAVLALADLKTAMAASYGDELVRLRKMQALSGQTIWAERAQQAQKLLAALQAEIPDAQTAGLAQATFQTQLGALTETYGGKVRVQMAPANSDTGIPSVWRVPATLDGELSLAQITQLIHEIETRPNLISVEKLTVTNRDKVRFSATLQAYYRLPASEATHAP